MRRLLSYLRFVVTNPGQIDFVNMGLGIDARFARCRDAWTPHLKESRKFVNNAIASYGLRSDSIGILGSGRLLDIDISTLSELCAAVILVDYDVAAVRKVHRQVKRYKNVRCECVDITGVIEAWTSHLSAGLGTVPTSATRGQKVEVVVQLLESLPTPRFTLSADIVVSLNVLSQLRVYWTDRVEAILSRRFGISEAEHLLEYEEVAHSLLRSEQQLEVGHTSGVLTSANRFAVVLSDRRFYYYKDDQAAWQVEEALAGAFPEELPGFTVVESDSWWWHIAPQGREDVSHGVINDVHARVFLRTQLKVDS